MDHSDASDVFLPALVQLLWHIRDLVGRSSELPIVAVLPSNPRHDRFDPGVGTERFDASGLGEKASPRGAGGIDDGIVVIEQSVREEALLEVEPQALDRVEFGAVGGR
jgi:hypothetical protein